ncbi:OpgC domain-containing protein [Robbsia andropogonis]|uniref:OpgC domain-containing protein n=1 Tax=Robbsia andropogonis TaxID=28092 RepID=UPI000464EB92|nr:OpgC domain-containing protein [Robbsia andropogonis]MCP1116829.1 OpgC domain-containing protein [Robbsia andropogonis]MCP1126492.1 OpgC domain-containing protein [Robbsia andropogonis]
MKVSPSRSVPVDFYRGLAMLMIVVDHIGGSILSRVTMHRFAYPDAAEAFVFLCGFALTGAWCGWRERAPETAQGKLLRRIWPIYRGFLICAVAMMSTTLILRVFDVSAPNLPFTAVDRLLSSPFSFLLDVATLREQPYLSSVLPMYLIFVACAPVLLPCAMRRPLPTLAASLVVWWLAPSALVWLPGVGGAMGSAVESARVWPFNPFAWQLMFVLGVLAHSLPVQRVFSSRMGFWSVGGVAIASVVGFGIYRVGFTPAYLDASLKQNLSWLRVVNFVAIAWVCAMVAQAGWLARLGKGINWIVAVGRQSMPCFIAGAVISLVLDSVLFEATEGLLDYPAGLLTDVVALSALFGFALSWRAFQSSRAPSPIVPTTGKGLARMPRGEALE